MKRYSEVVLNGHPDKFCDLISDRFIREVYKSDKEGYAQIEVSVWSDQIFLTGGIATRHKLPFSSSEIIVSVGEEIGYSAENHIDVRKYKIHDHICRINEDPRKWTNFVNDQSIVIGYAGYDAKTKFLPPEHFLCWYFREHLIHAIENGILKKQGPDGKILVVMNEDNSGWQVNTILITMQQTEKKSFIDFTDEVHLVIQKAYLTLQNIDQRWVTEWKDIKVMINPNGPLLNGGSDGDNGQTGRKLAMDYYGPRIPIGGGAMYGKDLSHIDRIGAINTRNFALEMVMNGAKESMVKVCYAPGINEPLSIDIMSDKRPSLNAEEFFNFTGMKRRLDIEYLNYKLDNIAGFYNINTIIL